MAADCKFYTEARLRTEPGRSPTMPASDNKMVKEQKEVTAVESVRFLGTIIAQDLKWEHNICSVIKKAQKRMFFLRQLTRF
ncbi:hypothetical protein CesoFtcFv8_002581 [Champsocephalus esox]|uniref:Alkylated DNA repair protein AlkB homologue 8 N-terminal domain-containing protein n=1 Tax=Champsocephalus esox TaxID=159716 RepID=A0AAN8HE38_9TELE|nr:hypothetical protein CesoFtcFv8_002581 [Champsocephalus esox]